MGIGRLFGRKAGKHDVDRPGGRSVEDLKAVLSPDAENTFGPFDSEDAPDDDLLRLDLGALRVPQLPGTEIRVEGSPEGQLTGVMVVDGESGVHMVVCAAPRTDSLWDEVRDSLAQNLRADGAELDVAEGAFGPEIAAVVATPQGQQRIRFVGVDGPRWMVRAVFSGEAGSDPTASPVLTEALRNTVVVRGSEAKPVREPLTLQLPKDAVRRPVAGQDDAENAGAEKAADDEAAEDVGQAVDVEKAEAR